MTGKGHGHRHAAPPGAGRRPVAPAAPGTHLGEYTVRRRDAAAGETGIGLIVPPVHDRCLLVAGEAGQINPLRRRMRDEPRLRGA